MDNFNKNIDKLISKILSEEIENKSQKLSEQMEGEWMEIDTNEELHGDQEKLDVAEPKGKLTSADFKKLRSHKKEEVEEGMYYDDLSDFGDYEGDEEEEHQAEKLSQKEPRYIGTKFGSFNDEDWFDEHDSEHNGDFDFDFDEEEFDEFEPFFEKHGKDTKWFAPGKEGKKFFDMYKQKFGPLKVRLAKGLKEAETEEGNAFSGALAKAKESGDESFEVDGKKYSVKEARDKFDGRKSKVIGVYSNIKKQREMKEDDNKWIQKTDMKKGALHKKLGIPEGDKIPQSKLKSLKAELHKKSEGDKKLSAADSKLLKQVNLALTLKSVKENVNVLSLTETELIDMIESLVLEQKVKDASEKNNISKKEATGLKKTEKVLGKNKSEGDSYFKELAKKMKDYLKDSTKGKYEMNPESFPQSNYDMEKEHNEMKYHPSEAVEEYIEAFSYPGMTNLVYDEIKPDDKRIDKQLKGDSTYGNAVTDKDGKALGNVVPSKVGERFKKNYDENVYGAEQMKASYKRQPQETIEVEGNNKTKGSLKSKQGADKSSSIKKATKILNTLESTENKKEKLINEDMEKMKNLIGYNRKTQ